MASRRDPARRPIVVLDGPAGAGKSTVARILAERLGVPMLDTGALYRAVALAARERGIAWDDEERLAELAAGLDVRFVPAEAGGQKVLLEGRDVSAEIRTPEISDGASRVSALPAVRRALLDLQRRLGAGGCVAEGRDMGTVVFPDADVKFFLTADLAARARRRRDQLRAQGQTPPPLAEIEAAIAERDARDRSRAVAPLRPAPDAIAIDTTDMDLPEVVETAWGHVTRTLPASSRAR